MNFKKLYSIIAAVVLAAIPAMADNWIMVLNTDEGWTDENETVSVSYTFDRNVVGTGGYLQPTSCEPIVSAKIKNNTDDFIYIDLSKTYITRNGEAELWQNRVGMSSDAAKSDNKSEGSNNNKLSQTAMPVPPHATKTVKFNIFPAKSASFDDLIQYSEYPKYLCYKSAEQAYQNEIFEYTADNSPFQIGIAFAYSTTEKAEKQVKILKNFYVGFAAAVNNTKPKNFEEVLPDYENVNWFTMQAYGYFPKKKAVKEGKKKDKKKEEKGHSKGLTPGLTGLRGK